MQKFARDVCWQLRLYTKIAQFCRRDWIGLHWCSALEGGYAQQHLYDSLSPAVASVTAARKATRESTSPMTSGGMCPLRVLDTTQPNTCYWHRTLTHFPHGQFVQCVCGCAREGVLLQHQDQQFFWGWRAQWVGVENCLCCIWLKLVKTWPLQQSSSNKKCNQTYLF